MAVDKTRNLNGSSRDKGRVRNSTLLQSKVDLDCREFVIDGSGLVQKGRGEWWAQEGEDRMKNGQYFFWLGLANPSAWRGPRGTL